MVIDLSMARKGIEMLYNCKCTIENVAEVEDAQTGITSQSWEIVALDILCKRSIKNIAAADTENNVAVVTKQIKLFLAPEIEVKAGSRISVTDIHGFTEYYKSTGKPAIFHNHQEVILETVERWA